jgi:hypothetical protein
MAGAAGANVNAVTKSGTNEYHGSVYGMFRDSDWFGEYPARVAGCTLDVTGLAFDEFDKDSDLGLHLGGPIMKDKLFFFVNYEKLKQTEIARRRHEPGHQPAGGRCRLHASRRGARNPESRTNVWGFDCRRACAGGDTELEEYAAKLDWNIIENHRASFRYSNLEPDPRATGGLDRQRR